MAKQMVTLEVSAAAGTLRSPCRPHNMRASPATPAAGSGDPQDQVPLSPCKSLRKHRPRMLVTGHGTTPRPHPPVRPACPLLLQRDATLDRVIHTHRRHCLPVPTPPCRQLWSQRQKPRVLLGNRKEGKGSKGHRSRAQCEPPAWPLRRLSETRCTGGRPTPEKSDWAGPPVTPACRGRGAGSRRGWGGGPAPAGPRRGGPVQVHPFGETDFQKCRCRSSVGVQCI